MHPDTKAGWMCKHLFFQHKLGREVSVFEMESPRRIVIARKFCKEPIPTLPGWQASSERSPSDRLDKVGAFNEILLSSSLADIPILVKYFLLLPYKKAKISLNKGLN